MLRVNKADTSTNKRIQWVFRWVVKEKRSIKRFRRELFKRFVKNDRLPFTIKTNHCRLLINDHDHYTVMDGMARQFIIDFVSESEEELEVLKDVKTLLVKCFQESVFVTVNMLITVSTLMLLINLTYINVKHVNRMVT